MPMQTPRIWPVLLSGGAGTRLWPLSRTALPKQLIALAGPQTMLQATAARVADGGRFHPPLVVASANHAAAIRAQLGAIGVRSRLLLEPAARNTAPAIALAAIEIRRIDPAALLLVMPSDHLVTDVAAMLRAVDDASRAAADGWLVTLGITPDAPETGYGYIELGAPIGNGVRQVVRFVEKPDLATASAYLASGGFAWNGGYLVARADAVIAALEAHAPAMLAACCAALDTAARDNDTVIPDAPQFAACPSQSFDYAVLEHAPRVAVAPVDMGWSDIGSWDALHGVGGRDCAGNTVSGRVIAVDTQNSLLRSDGPVLATVGVRDLNIIVTGDAVLVTAAGRAQDVKAVVGRLAGDPVLDQPRHIAEPWGDRRRLTAGVELTVEEISLNAGATWAGATGAATVLEGTITVAGITHGAGAHLTLAGAQIFSPASARLLVVAGTNPAEVDEVYAQAH